MKSSKTSFLRNCISGWNVRKPLRDDRTLKIFYYLRNYRKLLVILCVRNWSGDA